MYTFMKDCRGAFKFVLKNFSINVDQDSSYCIVRDGWKFITEALMELALPRNFTIHAYGLQVFLKGFFGGTIANIYSEESTSIVNPLDFIHD